jgi:hypothetical protein
VYEQFLQGKRVALVGPGAQTEIMKLGDLIDSFDVVARVGHYNVLVPDEIGSRTDIVCENFWFWTNQYQLKKAEQYEEWIRQGVKFINYVWMESEGLQEFKRMNNGLLKLRLQPNDAILAIRSAVDSPTKGFCSIFDFLTMPIKELFLVGFTCGRGFGYRKDYFTNPFNMPTPNQQYVDPNESTHNLDKWTEKLRGHDHRPEEELNYLRDLLKHPKVSVDPWCERVLCV